MKSSSVYNCFFRRHVCLCNLKHAAVTRVNKSKTVFSHLKRGFKTEKQTWKTCAQVFTQDLNGIQHHVTCQSVGNFYERNNFEPCFTKQILNVLKLWCEWGINLHSILSD